MTGASQIITKPTGDGALLRSVETVTNDQIRDASYSTLAAASTAAVARSKTLLITKAWTGLTTQTIAANLSFQGGTIKPASGQVVTLSGAIQAGNAQIFDYSAGGTVAITYPPLTAPVQWWGAVGDNTVDCTNPIQYAINALAGSANPSPVNFPAGIYKVTGTLTWATSGCVLQGAGAWNTEIRHVPASPNTDLFVFSSAVVYSTWNGIYGLRLRAGSATNCRYLVSAINNSKLNVIGCRFDFVNSGRAVNYIRATGMLGSLIENNEFVGPMFSTNDMVVIGTSAAIISTTVTVRQNTFVNGTGACLNLQGGSSSATMAAESNIFESALYGIKASTAAVIGPANHFEANSVSDVLTTSFATLTLIGNDFQHATTTPYIDLTGGGTVYWVSNTTNLSSGKTLFYAPAGTIVYPSGGPLLPYAVFPSGVINSGAAASIVGSAIPPKTYVNSGVAGAFTTQAFRGSIYELTVTSNSLLHIGELSLNFPVGETITFILKTNGSSAFLSSANVDDYPFAGQINDTGRAAGKYQVVVCQLNTEGKFVVASSPGWTTY